MLDDLKLKTDLNVLLSALGSNTTLTELDIRSDNISKYFHVFVAPGISLHSWADTVVFEVNRVVTGNTDAIFHLVSYHNDPLKVG